MCVCVNPDVSFGVFVKNLTNPKLLNSSVHCFLLCLNVINKYYS